MAGEAMSGESVLMRRSVRGSRILPKALYALALAALVALSAFLLFKGLGSRPFDSWDEARHGQSAFEMIQSGDWIVTTYLGEPDYWNLKPPLSMWGDALGFLVFGYNPLGLRIFSAGLMFLTYLTMAWYARRRYGRAESLAVLWMFCSCAIVYYLHFARTGQADGLSNAFYLLSILALLESERQPRALYLCALCFGFSFLARSWHAFLIPLTCFLTLLLTGRLRRLKLRNYLALIGLGLAPILPWAVLRYSRDGWTFFREMLEYDLLKRSGEAIEGHRLGLFYYFEYMTQMPAVVVAFALCAAALIARGVSRRRLRFDQIALAVAVLAPLALFTLAETKIDRYVFPTIAAVLLAGGLAAGGLVKTCARAWHAGRRGISALLAAGLAVCLALTGVGIQGNVGQVARLRANDPYQTALATVIHADSAAPDGGKLRVYMLFENDWPNWRQADVLLTSILCGDIHGIERVDGGLEPFLGDAGAWIVLSNRYLTDELTARCAIRYNDSYVTVLENPV